MLQHYNNVIEEAFIVVINIMIFISYIVDRLLNREILGINIELKCIKLTIMNEKKATNK